MKKFYWAVLLIICCSVFTVGAFAQTPSPSAPAKVAASPATSPATPPQSDLIVIPTSTLATFDSMIASRNPAVVTLLIQLASVYHADKLMALQIMTELANKKILSASNTELMTALYYISTEGLKSVDFRHPDNGGFADVRRLALELMDSIGPSAIAKQTAFDIITTEKDSTVLAQAVYLLGKNASESDTYIVPYVAQVIRSNNALEIPDNNLALVCLNAIDKMSKKMKAGTLANYELLSGVMDVVNGAYIKPVRQRAYQLILSIDSIS